MPLNTPPSCSYVASLRSSGLAPFGGLFALMCEHASFDPGCGNRRPELALYELELSSDPPDTLYSQNWDENYYLQYLPIAPLPSEPGFSRITPVKQKKKRE